MDAIMAAFNSHDLDAIMEFFADDSIWEASAGPEPWGKRLVGKAAIRAGFAAGYALLPDAHYKPEGHWVSGDKAVSEWALTGTLADGAKLCVRGCDLWEFSGQKIVRKNSYRKGVTPRD
ncbi:nuclear transport factor 2 family protein [Bordetella holmesii]|uniref:nuclear transport factor 2 family protein n=1 Tax=Bordetella holmesii TaxID=35814 RepID=UPI0027DB2F92|nr:nuclear transport factor 2 family protein [Bordetella holmesii]